MTLFIGGPADGWRIEVDPSREIVDIPINPIPPGFTPDSMVLGARTNPAFRYKAEYIQCGLTEHKVFIPNDWTCKDIIERFILNYGKPLETVERLNYLKNNEGEVYANDDRAQTGRPYKI